MKRAERAKVVLRRLKRAYPGAHCALHHRNAYELTVATILSAQCTDERVNQVTPALFREYPTPRDLAQADPARVEDLIRSTGFFRNKTKSLIGMAVRVTEDFDGKIPRTMKELLTLPGVARKTGNVVLSNAFNTNEGVVVDTHVKRLSNRIGLTRHSDVKKIEQDLIKVFPQKDWGLLSHLLIFHGRECCAARWPQCARCCLGQDACRSYQPDVEQWKRSGKA